jgi:hypothetical protein
LLRDFVRLAAIVRDLYTDTTPEIAEVRQVLAADRILQGSPIEAISRDFRLQPHRLRKVVESVQRHGTAAFVDVSTIPQDVFTRAKNGIAQMLLSLLAERRFIQLSNEITGAGVLKIEDHRPSRTDTDFRLMNGGGRPLCRLNIKFHGTAFRESRRHVGLEPDDCFPLATYKINNAEKRQKAEDLPYVFVVLTALDLASAEVARIVPDDYVQALVIMQRAVSTGKLALEERVVGRLLAADQLPRFESILGRMPEGQFRVLSASRAMTLLQAQLFERVHALSLKAFTRKFRNAEVDMHFSLSRELTPVRAFLQLTRESPQVFAVKLWRGEI